MTKAGTKTRRGAVAGRALRLLVSAALLAWVVGKVDWAEFGRTLRATEPLFLFLSLAISPLLVLISAWKWWILMRARGLETGLGFCFRLYLVGYFFNHLLPTNIGGDVVRIYMAGRRTGRTADAAASVFLERFTGVPALLLMTLAAIPAGPPALRDPRMGTVLGAVAASFAVVFWLIVDRRFQTLTHRLRGMPLMPKVIRLQEAIEAYREKKSALGACLAISVLFYLGAALNVYVSTLAFGVDLTLRHAFAATPVILIISMLPVSIGGWGLSEGAYVVALGACGVSPAGALSSALLIRLKSILLGLAGGILNAAPPSEIIARARAAGSTAETGGRS